MKTNDATEIAYKNGYEAGKRVADVNAEEYRKLKELYFRDEALKPLGIFDFEVDGKTFFCGKCPACRGYGYLDSEMNYCPFCGQKLKWEE